MSGVFQKADGATTGALGRGVLRRAAVAALIVGAAVGTSGLGGCMSYKAGHRTAQKNVKIAEMTPGDWPARDLAQMERLRDATPNVYRRLDMTGEKPLEQLSKRHQALVTEPMMKVVFNDIVGQGLLRIVDFPDGNDPAVLKSEYDKKQGFRPNAWFLSSLSLSDPRRPGYMARSRMRRAADEAGNPTAGVKWNNTDLDTAMREGIPMGFPPVQKTEPRGLLIHFVAMMGNEYETKVVDRLRSEGWAIIDIDSNPRVIGGGRSYEINNDTDLDTAAQSIARRIDDVLADHAYAAEAALEYCRKHRPDLPTDKVCVIGFSAGSLVVPPAAARLGDDVESAVLIAGGANLLEIAMESDLSDGGIKFKWGPGRGGKADRERLKRAYLKHSRLDPYRTATVLANKPVLQYWGQWDKWVPAESGRVLSERLNNPDKVTMLGGHCLLFYFLPGQSDRIAGWVGNSMANVDTRTAANRRLSAEASAGAMNPKATR
ncbi:MAG TPA: hypothetical protein VD997_01540 [Phycisphaerales bacterium]|nr:hypothetical protein [Phycisphaerales bacterium]